MRNADLLPSELGDLAFFVRVARAGSYSAAARALGTTKSTVSRNVARLEAQLGVRLLARTTRKVALTAEGRSLYASCDGPLGVVEAAVRTAEGVVCPPQGTLRLFAPPGVARMSLASVLGTFVARYPGVDVQLTCAERSVDVVSEGFDLAFLTVPVARELTVRVFGPSPRVVCGAPSYLERRGAPTSPRDLVHHDCLSWSTDPAAAGHWTLQNARRTLRVPVHVRVSANAADALVELMLDGAGLGVPPEFVAAGHIAEGRLRRVLPRWFGAPVSLSVACPPGRTSDPNVRALLDLVANGLPHWPAFPARRRSVR